MQKFTTKKPSGHCLEVVLQLLERLGGGGGGGAVLEAEVLGGHPEADEDGDVGVQDLLDGVGDPPQLEREVEVLLGGEVVILVAY